jgi:hypothetical protein
MEFSITVVGSKKFVTVCSTVPGMQLIKVLGGRNLGTTGCTNRILRGLQRMWKVWGGSGFGLFHFPCPPEGTQKSKEQEMSLKNAGIPAEIRVEYNININQKYYPLRNFLCVMNSKLYIDG